MRGILLLIFLAWLCAVGARAQSPDSSITRTILAAEDARFAAMMRGDTTALRAALDDSLSYVHSSGQRETREQFLETLGSGALRYEEFTPRRRDIRLLGADAAVVVGLAHVRALAAGQPRSFDVWYTAVYRRVGQRWRLTAWQTTLAPSQ